MHPAPTEGAVLPSGPHSEVRTDQQPQQSGPDKPKVTTRFMTKYERARILGTRALQIRSALLRLHSARHCSNLRGSLLLSVVPDSCSICKPHVCCKSNQPMVLSQLIWLTICAAA